jgi:lipoprotein-releasing system permease protein
MKRHLPYELFVAWRYLRARRTRGVIVLINFFSVLGVFLGVMSLIIVLALMTGFHDELRDRILGANSHLVMFSGTLGEITDTAALMASVEEHPQVVAAAPFIYRKLMIVHGRRSDGIMLKAIDPEQSPRVVEIKRLVQRGNFEALTTSSGDDGYPGIVLGDELALNLGAGLNALVKLISPFEVLTPTGYVPKTMQFRVVGLFHSGMFDYDTSWAFVTIPSAQKFFDMGEGVMGIEMRLRDLYAADKTAAALEEKLGGQYVFRTWVDMNGPLFSALKLEKMVSFLFIVLIVIVASFGMTSSLTLLVMDKKKEIGVLKAMGASRRSLLSIFLGEGLLLGLTGTVLGALAGFVVCWVLDSFQLISLPGDVYFITHVPFIMKTRDFVLTGVAALLISLQATLYPALSAANLDPVEAIREE